jgi:hypothetical protein
MRTLRLGSIVVLMMALAWMGLAAATETSDLTGVWDLSVQLGGTNSAPKITLKQQGQTLSGNYQGMLGSAPVVGTVDGVNFKFTVETSGIREEYSGKIAADTLTGKISIPGLGEGTFTGKRSH